jgi:hypothetical protein
MSEETSTLSQALRSTKGAARAKAFEALIMLVEDPGHLVDKDDLNEAALARYLSWRRPMLPSTSPD